jgi:hypothetical protein
MTSLVTALIGLSALAFVAAVINNFGEILPIPATARGLSLASANLALIAIALILSGRATGRRS